MRTSSHLLFSASDLQLARDNVEREPVRGALRLLDARPEDALARAQLLALRFLFYSDAAAGQAAAELLQAQDLAVRGSRDLPSIQRVFGWLHVMAMLRGARHWTVKQARFRAALGEALPELADSAAEGDLPRALWLAAVVMAAGIVLEDESAFERAASTYRRTVDRHIHPEGYFKGVVDVDDARQTYAAQFAATGALALLSEMAEQAGEQLWSYNNRAVSANTAATYTFYYYFFPESWRWEEGLSREQTMAIMRREGAYFELVNRRSPLRGGDELFAEQRPLFSAVAGGLTTLTHGLKPPAKRRWRLF